MVIPDACPASRPHAAAACHSRCAPRLDWSATAVCLLSQRVICPPAGASHHMTRKPIARHASSAHTAAAPTCPASQRRSVPCNTQHCTHCSAPIPSRLHATLQHPPAPPAGGAPAPGPTRWTRAAWPAAPPLRRGGGQQALAGKGHSSRHAGWHGQPQVPALHARSSAPPKPASCQQKQLPPPPAAPTACRLALRMPRRRPCRRQLAF